MQRNDIFASFGVLCAGCKRKLTRNKTRLTSLLLSFVLLFGLVPSRAFAMDTPPADWPGTIKLAASKYSGKRFWTEELGNATNRVVLGNVGGMIVPMFCADHSKNLNTTPGALTWGNAQPIAAADGGKYAIVEPFLVDYMYNYFNSKHIDEMFPNLPEGAAESPDEPGGPYTNKMSACRDIYGSYYMSEWTLLLYSSYAQCAIWLAGFGKLTDLTDEAQLRMLAKNVMYAYNSMYSQHGINEESLAFNLAGVKSIIEHSPVDRMNGYYKGTWEFMVYYPDSSRIQPMIIGKADAAVEDEFKGKIEILKHGKLGSDAESPLSGVEFTVYADAGCTTPVDRAKGTTDASGKLTIDVEWRGGETHTFYVKETNVPDPYYASTQPYVAVVKNGETVALNGGAPIVNTSDEPDDPEDPTPPGESVLKKINSVNGAGVGPATFSFYGPGETVQDFTTNARGELTLQWSNPIGENYIAPGTYAVREKAAPRGFAPSEETLQITFNSDGRTHTGPIVFKDDPLHKITIRKVDEQGNHLEGAVFDVYKNGSKVTSITTNARGEAVYNGGGIGLETALYGFYEVKAPTGYLLPYHRYQEVFVNTADVSNYDHVLQFVDFREPEIIVKKVDKSSGAGAAGAIFDVMIDGTKIGTFGPTGWDGNIVIPPAAYRGHLAENADSWTLTVQEVNPPYGYLLDDPAIQTVELKKGQTLAPIVFKDTAYPEIVIRKLDRESGEGLADCEFKIVINGGRELTERTNAFGEVRITYAEYAEFIEPQPHDNLISVTETRAPNGYNRDGQPENANSYTISKNLAFGMSTLDFIFRDTEYRDIRVVKKDAQTKWRLSDASFTLTSLSLDGGGSYSRTLTTDATGEVLFENVPNGTYDLYESAQPFGYAPNDEHRTIVVKSEDAPIVEYVYENEPLSGLLVRKIDSVTLQPIQNVKMVLERLANDAVVETWERWTDANGVIVLENAEEGWYRIHEEATVDGYVLDSEPKTVYVSNQHDAVTVTFQNNQANMLNILKRNRQTGEPLAGATFEIRTAGGSHVANVTTGINGYANLANLTPGSYVVQEVKAPAGHLKDPYPQTFEVKEDDAGRVYTLIFDDSATIKLYLVKHDRQTNAPLDGAEYRVSLSNGTVIEDKVVTDRNGIALVTGEGLGEGTYYIDELRPPAGYLIDEERVSVYIKDGEVKTVDLYDSMPGGIRLLKLDAATRAPLENAEFELYTLDSRFMNRYTTGSDGYFKVSSLDPGYYYLKESRAPEGYQLDTEWRRVEVKEFGVTDVVWTNSSLSSLTIQKIDRETKQPVKDAEYEVRTLDGTLVSRVTTDSSGVAVTSKLEEGYYSVSESKSPDGYYLNTESRIVRINANVPAKITVEDQAMKGAVVTKLDAEDNRPLSGAVFELRTLGNELLESYTTDGSGTFTTRALEPSHYYLVEVKAPEGYLLGGEPILFEVEEGKAPSIIVHNRKASSIGVFKTDSATGAPVANAEYALKDEDGNILELITTDNAGWAYTTRQRPGRYTIVETRAPSGYSLDETEHKVKLEEGKPAILRLSDDPDTSLAIVKVDKSTRALLAGAVFELRYDTGHGDCTFIGTYTTDSTGRVVTEPLTPGFYMIKEVSAPAGYAVLEEEVRYCVKTGVTNEVVIEDQMLGVLTLRKLDSRTNKPIPGAVFKVETATHSLVGLYESDANGEAVITGITEGTYIVTETVAPPGYSLSANPQAVVVVEYGKNNYVDFQDAENASLLIDLRDVMSGEYLSGGKFTVTRCSDNTIIYESATDVAGSIVVGNLTPGKYIVTQTFAPEKYYIIENQQTVMVPAGTQQTLHFFNVTAGLIIEGVDSISQVTLEGVRFQVTRNEDNIVIGEFVTDQDGLALVSGLKPGMYTVEVLYAPDNYSIDLDRRLVHVKETGEAHVTFTFTPYAGITVRVVDEVSKAVVSGCVIEVWRQNGELVNTYRTDTTGTVMSDVLAPGFYVVKLLSAPEGYVLGKAEATVELKNGVPVTQLFEVRAKGTLTVISKDQNGKSIPGMKLRVTTIDGTIVGEYVTEQNGCAVIAGLEAGYYRVSELSAPEGYSILTDAKDCRVKGSGNTEVVFEHAQIFGLQIRTVCRQTGDSVPDAGYRITKPDGSIIGSYRSDSLSLIYVTLVPGYYVVTPADAPAGYTFSDPSPRNIEVKANSVTSVEFELSRLSSLRVKVVDGRSGNGLYGVRILLKNGAECIKEYATDNAGYVTLEQALLNGAYVLEMVSAPDGYLVDRVPKSVSVLNAETTEVVWALYQNAGQIQIVVRSKDYNKSRDLPAGTLLQGTVFEIMDADTYQVMGRAISDASGIAASGGLPIGRYIVKQIGAAPYYAVSDKETEVRLKVNNDVVRIEYENPSVIMKAEVAQKSNKTVKAGSSMRVDVTAVNSLSDVRLDNFFFHIKVPTDAARISTLSTGTWKQAVWYSIRYKTNMQDYRLLSSNLLSTSKYQFDLSTAALGLQLGEYVTDVRYEFGTVPAGFTLASKPAYMLYVLNTTANGYKLLPRVEVGGQYNTISVTTNGNVSAGVQGSNFTGTQIAGNSGQWTTDAGTWTTTVKGGTGGTNLPGSLPKTGY